MQQYCIDLQQRLQAMTVQAEHFRGLWEREAMQQAERQQAWQQQESAERREREADLHMWQQQFRQAETARLIREADLQGQVTAALARQRELSEQYSGFYQDIIDRMETLLQPVRQAQFQQTEEQLQQQQAQAQQAQAEEQWQQQQAQAQQAQFQAEEQLQQQQAQAQQQQQPQWLGP